jgi:hypothetical protein
MAQVQVEVNQVPVPKASASDLLERAIGSYTKIKVVLGSLDINERCAVGTIASELGLQPRHGDIDDSIKTVIPEHWVHRYVYQSNDHAKKQQSG